ncbi:4a-hydroxytetrahydrobiopterin dehydratase [Candidatus Uhrbacteria bacterium]|nr:4a-hydroxytetrahydrobiopterin dehydratase [Candidatus Uhrbacteria bacterium]
MNLLGKKCGPCEGGVPPFTPEQIAEFLPQLKGTWEVVDARKLRREFKFEDFAEAMKFVNKVADLAESQGHHPDFHIHWNKVQIELWTHEIGGLAENDFIVAAKIETLV